MHVLVTAGLHLGAVAALALLLLQLLALPRWLTCLAASRSRRGASSGGAARNCPRCAPRRWRRRRWPRALAVARRSRGTRSRIAALVIALLCGRQSVGTVSFALSFSCVGAIFACAGPLERWIEARVALPATRA